MASFYLIPGLVHLPMCHKPSSLLFSIPSGCTSFHSFVVSFSGTLALGPFLKFSMGCHVLYFSLTSVCSVPSQWSDFPLEDPSPTTSSCHIFPYIYIYIIALSFSCLWYFSTPKIEAARFLWISKFQALIGITSQQTVIFITIPSWVSDSKMK